MGLRACANTVPEIVARASQAMIEADALHTKGNLLRRGTTFFLSADGIAALNLPLLQGASSVIDLGASRGCYVFDGVVSMPADPDLAVLEFCASYVPSLRLGSSQAAADGEKVRVVGNPENLPEALSSGFVSDVRVDRLVIQMDAPLSRGFDGSPVLDEGGRVTGVAIGQAMNGQKVNSVIPIKQVRTALQSTLGNSVTSSPNAPAEPAPQLTPEKGVEYGNVVQTSPEEAFCLAELAPTERELNRVYEALRDPLDAASRQQLRREQVLWIAERSKELPQSDWFLSMTQQRIKELRNLLWDLEETGKRGSR